jgi:hypothetical protein
VVEEEEVSYQAVAEKVSEEKQKQEEEKQQEDVVEEEEVSEEEANLEEKFQVAVDIVQKLLKYAEEEMDKGLFFHIH